MVDTISQYNNIKEKIDKAVDAVISSGMYINGPVVQEFRQHLATYLDVAHVVPCANGTDALQIALMTLNLKPGDEVITTPFTFVATAEVIALLGLKPVFVDIEYDTFNIDPTLIEAAITEKTKAIIPVHIFGQSANMSSILEIASKHQLYVVEDAAQSIGADYIFPDGRVARTGTIGDIGTTSFYPSKNLGAYGDGGAIFTQNDELAAKLWTICNHGSNVKYYHSEIGVNSRLDAIQAAILNIKLSHLDEYNASRQEAANTYQSLLGDLEELVLPYQAAYSRHVFHQYTLRVKAGEAMRDAIKADLQANDIPSMIYYPVPLHLQDAYKGYGYKVGDFPIAEQASREVLSLPMHSELDIQQLRHICKQVKQAVFQSV